MMIAVLAAGVFFSLGNNSVDARRKTPGDSGSTDTLFQIFFSIVDATPDGTGISAECETETNCLFRGAIEDYRVSGLFEYESNEMSFNLRAVQSEDGGRQNVIYRFEDSERNPADERLLLVPESQGLSVAQKTYKTNL